MIKWTVLLAVALMLWIAEMRQELNDINSEFVQPKKESGNIEEKSAERSVRLQKEGHRGMRQEHDR